MCAKLLADLVRVLAADPPPPNSSKMALNHRMFEVSRANLRLFELEPIVSFARPLIDGSCHVIYNTWFCTYPGGGITGCHQADPQQIRLLHREVPYNIRLSFT